MATGHHYGPAPWVGDLDRPEWNPTYYNRADARGIGFDRTASGSDAVAQYAPPVARRFADLGTVGDDYLLRSEEHTSELQSLMRISYAVFCLKKKTTAYSTKRATSPVENILH